MLNGAVTLTQAAQDDLLTAWLYIAKQDMQAADGVLDAIDREARTLLLQPLMGRARPELGAQKACGAGLRQPRTSSFMWLTSKGITVLRVLHHARDLRLASFDESA